MKGMSTPTIKIWKERPVPRILTPLQLGVHIDAGDWATHDERWLTWGCTTYKLGLVCKLKDILREHLEV